MNRSSVEKTVQDVLVKKLNLDPAKVMPEARLAEDLGLDSFGGVEVMFEIEEAFGLKIADSDIQNVRTVNDIVDYVVLWQAKATESSETPPVQ